MYIKKILSIFLIGVLLFNVFIPKNQEIKSNFIVALNCVVNTVETNFYDRYSNVVMSVISSILSNFNIETIAEAQLSKQQSQKTDNNIPVPVNTSADSCVIMQSSTGSQIETLKANISYLIYETTNKLYNVYENIKVNGSKEISTMGILFFILFSILVVRIKDTIAVILNKKYRMLNRLA
jgi:hypothetical protein